MFYFEDAVIDIERSRWRTSYIRSCWQAACPEQEQPIAGQTTIRVLIKSSGGKVNIRTGNGTSYSRITAVAPGTMLEYVASAFNGWQAVKIGSQVGWVSGEYSEITTE